MGGSSVTVALALALGGCNVVFGVDPGEGTPGDGPVHSCAGIEVADGLIGWWPLTTVNQGRVPACKGPDGICADGTCPTVENTGPFGGALRFGAGRFVEIPGQPLVTGPVVTVAFWLRSDTDTTEYTCPVNKLHGDMGYNTWQLCLDQRFPTSGWVDAANVAHTLMTPAYQTRKWTHIAMRWDGSAAVVDVDGLLRAASGSTGIVDDGSPIVLGADRDNSNELSWLEGALADVRIYNRFLTNEEIMQLASVL
ncbi:MAG TPA: LamG domain-containing protein [Ilumatobacteraceae bacterium]|nr:LamG domain-containing protein [Ilumatobacteraceae bacterium]